jgi:ATP-binding cassette subfamily B protein
VKRIGDAWQTWNQALAGAERLFEIIDAPVDPALSGSTASIGPLTRGVALRDVRFAYPGAPDETVLRGVSIEIPAGKTVAIVGSSGAGKSTIVQLLMRLYDPTAGDVFWDDVPLRAISRRVLLPRIAVVAQQPFLFNDTVEANIRVGRPDATNDEVREAARQARVDEFIPRLADGWNTQVGNRGAAISGGQAQRITIARAILRNASLLLLDEATSNLDPESEALVQEALSNAQKGRTTVVIAHRLSTVERADKIVVLDRGLVVEEGSHAELLARGGVYARMHRRGGEPSDGLA